MVRQLVRLEDEVSGWVSTIEQQLEYPRPLHEVTALRLKQSELQALAADLHALAHRTAHMPMRNRDLLRTYPD